MDRSWQCGMPRLAGVVILSAIGGAILLASGFVAWALNEDRKDSAHYRNAKVPG